MATYADWSASKQFGVSGSSQQHGAAQSNQSSQPIKLLIDEQGNLLHSSTSSSHSVLSGYAGDASWQQVTDLQAMTEDMEASDAANMSINDQQEIVQDIRNSHRSSGGGAQYYHATHQSYASVNEEQKAWISRQIPPSTILLVIGRSNA
jgi:hypothetical protein